MSTANSTTQRAILFLLRELLLDVLYFPVWWYSFGLRVFGRALWREWIEVEERLSLRILLKNIGRPMYADYSKSGRIISFFFRVFLIVVRGAVLAIWTIVELVVLFLWVSSPVLAIGMLVRQLFPV